MSLWYKKLAIILPAFNESKNLRILLTRIFKVSPDIHVIIVDDSNIVENVKIRKIAQSFKNVEVFTREKKMGRGSAVLYGFEQALKNKQVDYFVEMDTDLAHDPAELQFLQTSMKNKNADLVIGSRYLQQSKIVDWPLRRLVMSKVINFFLNLWLGLNLHDYTNGYRLYKRKAVEHLVKTGLKERNFIALSESAFLIKDKGYSIAEVPISFTDRKHGQSSVGVQELFASLFGALRIKIRYTFQSNKKKSWFPLSKKQSLIVVLAIAVFLRLWTLNAMGKTWDEPAYVEQGYYMVEAIRKGDWDNKQLYHSDHPPFARYVYGLAEQLQIGDNHSQHESFPYDYTYPRLVSLVFSLLSIIIIFLFAWQYVSPFVGFISGMILAMLPFFLGFSQLATLESLNMFFFTASIASFLKMLDRYSRKWMAVTGVSVGLALLVKQSNLLLLPLLGTLYLFWYLYTYTSKRTTLSRTRSYLQSVFLGLQKQRLIQRLAAIIFISIGTFFAFWPFVLFHIHEVLQLQDTMWVKHVALPPPEVFFGRLMLVPMPYYVVFFLITTPIFILVLFFLGLLRIDRIKKWMLYAVVIWFLFSFIQSFYTFKQHGIRYIIQIYAPMAIIAAIGFETLVYAFAKKKSTKIYLIFAFFVYMSFILWKATPYYLDYFNGFTGGTNGVYEKRMFQLGWWGQGLKEAGTYLEINAKKGSSIGLTVQPPFSFPELKDFKIEEYNEKNTYDYVVVSYFRVLREGFDDSYIRRKYKFLHCVKADNACLVFIYKKI